MKIEYFIKVYHSGGTYVSLTQIQVPYNIPTPRYMGMLTILSMIYQNEVIFRPPNHVYLKYCDIFYASCNYVSTVAVQSMNWKMY